MRALTGVGGNGAAPTRPKAAGRRSEEPTEREVAAPDDVAEGVATAGDEAEGAEVALDEGVVLTALGPK